MFACEEWDSFLQLFIWFSNFIPAVLKSNSCFHPFCVFIVRSNARRQPDSAQQWQALFKGAQLGAA